jgi:hypothetical protein
MQTQAGSNEMAPFSYAYYKHMLSQCLIAGFKITSFQKFDETIPKTVILRHDVDYTLDGLMEFAEIEAALGCSATYLFRVHADEYNLYSPVSVATIRALEEMGHEIGLHFEAMNVGRALQLDPGSLLKSEKAIIEIILGKPILSCSEHREISGVLHHTPLFDSLCDPYDAGFEYYAMDPRYAKAMKYLSDSNATWREGDVLKHLEAHKRFQLLVHPDWWFESDLLLKGPYYHPRSTHP